MNKFCIFVGVTLFGWIGWWLGMRFGLMTAFAIGSIGSLAGVYIGWKVNRDFLS